MATVRDEQDSELTSGSLLTGVGRAQVLPSLVGRDRTGRVSPAQDEAPALEVWIARGRVVDAGWGRLRALSALEMGAVFLPRASFVFSDGLQSQTRTFDLSPTDLAARLAEVAREGAAVTGSIPGPRAVPTRVEPPRQRPPREPESVRPVATTAPTPAAAPAAAPTVAPQPTVAPTVALQPTAAPTLAPAPAAAPTVAPQPTAAPTLAPAPVAAPTVAPQATVAPTVAPQ